MLEERAARRVHIRGQYNRYSYALKYPSETINAGINVMSASAARVPRIEEHGRVCVPPSRKGTNCHFSQHPPRQLLDAGDASVVEDGQVMSEGGGNKVGGGGERSDPAYLITQRRFIVVQV